MSGQRLDEAHVGGAANGNAYNASGHSAQDSGDIPAAPGREFSLKSFKCFARQHPLLVGLGAAGIGTAVATLGAGYVIYRGAQRSLPMRVLKLARVLVTF
jgi:hypothetical protein